MKNVLLDILKTEHVYIEIDKIILNLKKCYIYNLYSVIFCIPHVKLFIIYLI